MPPDEKEQPSYQPIYPYGDIAPLVRRYRQTVPESAQDDLDEFADALEYAAKEVKNRDSERSHYSNVDVSFCRVMQSTEDLPDRQQRFISILAGQLCDVFDVLHNGYRIEDMKLLRDPAGQLARILREQERSGDKQRPPGR